MIDEIVTLGNDFFIVSQKLGPNQGTASPTHYIIIENDFGKEINRDIAVLSYKLCFLFYNWTGAIKSPAPLRYATQLATFVGTPYNPKNP